MSSTETRGVLAWAPAVLSGLVLALTYPRPDLFPLAFVALVPFLLSLRAAAPSAALARGYLLGAAFFAPLLYWILPVMTRYGGLPWLSALAALALLVGYLASYCALFALLLSAAWRRLGPPALLVAPVAWVGLEILRGRLITGFPWGLLGYSQYRNLPLLQAAAVGGIYLVSFLVMLGNVAVALWLAPGRRAGVTRLAAAMLFVAVALAHLAGWLALGAPAAGGSGGIAVAAIQGNVAQDRKWVRGEEGRILDDLVRMTRDAASRGARLIVWPEAASPLSFHRPVRVAGGGSEEWRVVDDRAYTDRVSGLARDLDVTLIAGSVDYRLDAAGALHAYNSAFVVPPGGGPGDRYDKIHLVPFGEYVPLHRLLFFVDRLVQGAIGEFASGRRLRPVATPLGPAGTFICYEAVFPELVRRLARHAGFLVNITNDAWYGRTAGPYQHLAMAVVRAVETRRYLVRAANTGISAIIDPYGRILDRSRLQERTVLLGRIVPRRDLTPYVRTGDAFAWACVILTALVAAALRAAFVRQGTCSKHPETPGDPQLRK
jgi:apolipoprotein N-acyltransferase